MKRRVKSAESMFPRYSWTAAALRPEGSRASVSDLFLFEDLVTPPESCQLHGGGISGLSKSAQGGVTTVGTFDYFAGDDPTGPVFLAASWKKQARTLKGDFHISYSPGIEGISDHLILPSLPGQNIGLRPISSVRYPTVRRTPGGAFSLAAHIQYTSGMKHWTASLVAILLTDFRGVASAQVRGTKDA